jgi:drug/metabolite transporter (DMT)-like permease
MGQLSGAWIAGLQGEVAAICAAFLWALATTLYSGIGQHVPPLELNLAKGMIATALLLITLLVRGDLLAAIDPLALGLLLLSGVVGIGLGDTAYLESLKRLGVRRTLLLEMLAPPSAGLIALAFLGERLSAGAWCGIGLTLLGVAWVVTERSPGPSTGPARAWPGIGFGLLAALAQASGAVLSHAALIQTSTSPLWSSLLRLAAGVVTLVIWLPLTRQPVGRWLKHQQSGRTWRVIAIATFIGSYLAIWLQQTSLKFTDAGIAQTLLATSPLFVLPIAAFQGERISPRAVLGILVALAGIGLLFGLM